MLLLPHLNCNPLSPPLFLSFITWYSQNQAFFFITNHCLPLHLSHLLYSSCLGLFYTSASFWCTHLCHSIVQVSSFPFRFATTLKEYCLDIIDLSIVSRAAGHYPQLAGVLYWQFQAEFFIAAILWLWYQTPPFYHQFLKSKVNLTPAHHFQMSGFFPPHTHL